MNPSKIDLTILIPRYHETIDQYLWALSKFTKWLDDKQITAQFVISQNGEFQSLDETLLKSSTHHELVLLKSKNSGLGVALKQAAIKIRGDYTFFTSVDNPFEFSDLEKMWDKKSIYDLIIGSKLHLQSVYEITKMRKIVSYLQYFSVSLILRGFPVKDASGSFFFNSKVVDVLKSASSDDYFIQTELIWKSHKNRLKIGEVPVIYRSKSSKTTIKFIRAISSHLGQILRMKKNEK